jgi:hypothetical protein
MKHVKPPSAKPKPKGPPFSFDGVTSRVFPLRAHTHALQRVCDLYLNLFPEEIYFRPAAPYVLLTLLNYGQMSYATETAAHYGWVSQNEVYFGIPLDWGRLEGPPGQRRWKPLGAGVVAPFIFVDQPWSVQVGREVYGWPKEPAAFKREVSTWASRSPADREHLLTLETGTFVTPYAGEERTSVPLLDIDRSAPPIFGANLWQPPLSIDNPWFGPLALTREAFRFLGSAGLRDASSVYLPLIAQATRAAFGGQSPYFYTANLKQIRNLEKPTIAAYQAITMAPMRLTALNRVGMMGGGRIALGDPTGGYRIRIHRHPLFPIIETLGLIVSSEEPVGDARDVALRGYTTGAPGALRLEHLPAELTSSDEQQTHGVATLAPLFPYWLEADLEYGGGDTRCWGSPDVDGGRPHSCGSDGKWIATGSQDHENEKLRATFDPTWGARATPAPPYYYPQLTLRVLVLPAPGLAAAIQHQGWWPPAAAGQFRLCEGFEAAVLLVVATSEQMGAGGNSAGQWWQRRLSFFVPVIWTRDGQDTVALLSITTFAETAFAKTAQQVGTDVIGAELHAPPDAWLEYGGPEADRRVLWLATNVLPGVNVDAEAAERILLEVIARRPPHPLPTSPPPAAVRPPTPLLVVGRRQIRDARDPDTLAYQEWFCANMHAQCPADGNWHFNEADLELRLHRYPGQIDLATLLGLDTAPGTEIDQLEFGQSVNQGRVWEGALVNVIPTRSGWSNLAVTHESNTSLCVKIHDRDWTPPPAPRPPHPVDARPALRGWLDTLRPDGRPSRG